MTRPIATLGAAILTAALVVAHSASAAPGSPGDMAAMQLELKALRAEYDARIGDLETRLKAAEAKADLPQTPAPLADAAVAPSEIVIAEAAGEPQVRTTSPNAMNPGVSVVLNGNYVAMSRDPATTRIAGYPMSDDARLKSRGFSLDESEITLAANVDPYLSANLTASFGGDNQVSVEEAYIQTTALPAGLTLKAGRFFSAIGYLNERHAHNWTFIDMPLPYRALLGKQYGDDGVQLRWLAPTPFFLELGGEVYRGDHFPAGGAAKNRAGTQTAFVHTGGDINTASSWLAALSYLHAEAHGRTTDADSFSGSSDLGIASLVYKWAPGGNPTQKNLALSAEYFLGRQDGTFNDLRANRDQNGWYAQGVFQFTQRWSAGLRYAALGQADPSRALAGSALDGFGHAPRAVSGLLEYDSSEFGRFRLEITHDTSDLRPNDEALFQYTVVYGPHGAHRY